MTNRTMRLVAAGSTGWLCLASLVACDSKKEPAPAATPPAATTPAAAASEHAPGADKPAPPAPSPAPAPAVGGLAQGKHGCTMIDGTGSYNRLCTVSEVGGKIQVKAPGTALNPTIGFELSATGGPDSYQIEGKMTAFDACSGEFKATATREMVGGSPWFVAKFAPKGKGPERCKIMIRAPKSQEPSKEAQCTGDGANSELPCTLKDGRWGWCKGGACKDICPAGYSYHPNDTRCHQQRDCKPGMGDDGKAVRTAQCNECFGQHCFDAGATKDLL